MTDDEVLPGQKEKPPKTPSALPKSGAKIRPKEKSPKEALPSENGPEENWPKENWPKENWPEEN